jgi:PKD repeat protein
LSTTYTGSLALGATDTVIVGTYNNWPGGASSFAAYTALSGDQTITNDTLTESIDIALTPMSPSATSASVCQGDSAQLVTSSTGTTYWYDAPMSGNLVAAGDTLNTGPLAASTNYYVESRGSVTAGLTTTFAGGNSCGGGNMFDITAISEVTLDSFDLNMSSSANVDIYYKVGTYVGFEGTAAAWTLLGSYAVTSAGVNTPSRCLIGGLTIPAGQTYGIFVSTTTIAYTTLTGGTTYSSPEMSIYSGTGLCGLFSGFNFPRGFNGTVYYQAEGCASQRTEVPVTVTSLPVVNLQDSAYCGSAVLDAGSGGSGYLWSNSATTQTTTVTTSGQYSVMVSNGNCSTGDTANIVINPFPVVNLGTDTTLCDGASLTLDAGNPGGTYMWSTSATTQTISVSGAGSYTAMVNSQDGCQGSDDIVIGVLDSPAGIASNDNTGCPMIAFAGTSTGGPSSTTTWDFGDGNTGTGFNPNHTYAANGQYTVTYTQINDCGTSVSTVTVDINCITGIEDPAAGTAVIFPNPTQNTASLQLELNTSGPASVVLTDITGKVISVRNFDLVSGTTSIPFDMTSFSKGIYVVKVSSETFNWHGKLIRE